MIEFTPLFRGESRSSASHDSHSDRILYDMVWQEELDKIAMDMSTCVQVWPTGCVVEGHRGLLECSPTDIQVRRRRGRIHVEGEDLTVAAVTRTEVWVRGKVRRVEWHE